MMKTLRNSIRVLKNPFDLIHSPESAYMRCRLKHIRIIISIYYSVRLEGINAAMGE